MGTSPSSYIQVPRGYIQPISFLVQFSEGSSVLLQFLVAGSQVPLFDLSFNLVTEFFA